MLGPLTDPPTSSFCPGPCSTSFLSQVSTVIISWNFKFEEVKWLPQEGSNEAVRDRALVDTCFVFRFVLATSFYSPFGNGPYVVPVLPFGERTLYHLHFHATPSSLDAPIFLNFSYQPALHLDAK